MFDVDKYVENVEKCERYVVIYMTHVSCMGKNDDDNVENNIKESKMQENFYFLALC